MAFRSAEMAPENVSGDQAAGYDTVRLDSFEVVNDGKLLEANQQTGVVRWKDKTDTEKRVEFGPHMVRIMPRGHG